jgi:tetratricopeptide (TPR) repeat protein
MPDLDAVDQGLATLYAACPLALHASLSTENLEMAKKIKLKKPETEEDKVAAEAEKALEEQGIQDEFQAKGFELVTWMQDHSGIVLSLIGVVLAAGLAIGVVQFTKSSADAAASKLFETAKAAYDAPLGDAPAILTGSSSKGPSFADAKARSQASREAFRAVVDSHKTAGIAAIAHLYIGHTSLALGEYDEAVKGYEAFLSSTSKDEPMRFLALDGLATALDAKGDKAGAIKRLDELVALPSRVHEDVALIRLARLHKSAGDAAASKKAAERLISDFPESPFKAQAEEFLSAASAG